MTGTTGTPVLEEEGWAAHTISGDLPNDFIDSGVYDIVNKIWPDIEIGGVYTTNGTPEMLVVEGLTKQAAELEPDKWQKFVEAVELAYHE